MFRCFYDRATSRYRIREYVNRKGKKVYVPEWKGGLNHFFMWINIDRYRGFAKEEYDCIEDAEWCIKHLKNKFANESKSKQKPTFHYR